MADSINQSRFLNPWKLHLQKLGLELNCPLCLMLMDQPVLLPCNHIFCKTCITVSTQFEYECLVCKASYSDQELREAPFMEKIVAIYRSMETTLIASLNNSNPDARRVLYKQLKSVPTDSALEMPKEPVQIAKGVNLSFRPSCVSSSMSKLEDMNENENENFVRRIVEGQESEICQLTPTLDVEGDKPCETPNLHQVTRSSSGSPPSFGDTKGSQEDSSDRGSEHSKKYSPKRPAMNTVNSIAVQEVVKRQKKLDYGSVNASRQSDACSQAVIANLVQTPVPCPGLESNSGGLPSDLQLPSLSNSSGERETICAFCQSSNISQATGVMLHYRNGKPVKEDNACPDVIHVHTKCIEWAPQVYFKGENVNNLESELARGAKLKCNSCGLKGAALGCYVATCRKSYHVPCAVEVSDCRWDCNDFLLLCPTHHSTRFPGEKRVKRHITKQPQPASMKLEQPKFWDASTNGTKEWVMCGSALSTEEKVILMKFAGMSGVTVSKLWKPDVTHVIAATDENGAYSRTLKVLMAISNGKWILTIDWIKACMAAMHPVNEEPYEISLDNHGTRDGPKTGRLRLLANEAKLLNRLHFYFTGNFIKNYLRDLQMLVRSAGGTVLSNKEEMLTQINRDPLKKVLVVYNIDTSSMQICQPEEANLVVLQRHQEAEELAGKTGSSRVIDHTWLLESIAACTLQPFAG